MEVNVMSTTTRFDPDGYRFDQSSYFGRVRHFLTMMDPRNVFTSDEKLKKSIELVESYRKGNLPPGITDKDLWNAKQKIDANIHPDLQEKIPLVFRMSMFMPVNLPITGGMLLSTTIPSQMVFQFLNQTYNACFNYANRNATVEVNNRQLATSFGIATSVACGMSYGLGKIVQSVTARMNGGVIAGPNTPLPFKVKAFSRAMPWFAVASAGMANALAMRYKEGIDGISIFDADGNEIGTSVQAGRLCLTQVALTRAILPIPILLLPPFFMDLLESTKSVGRFMAQSANKKLIVQLGVAAMFLQFSMPLAMAVFPQRGSVSSSSLEAKFQNIVDKNGRRIDTFFFNKGL